MGCHQRSSQRLPGRLWRLTSEDIGVAGKSGGLDDDLDTLPGVASRGLGNGRGVEVFGGTLCMRVAALCPARSLRLWGPPPQVGGAGAAKIRQGGT